MTQVCLVLHKSLWFVYKTLDPVREGRKVSLRGLKEATLILNVLVIDKINKTRVKLTPNPS